MAFHNPGAPGHGGTDPGLRNLMRDGQNPDMLVPPSTDHGSLPNLRFSFSDASTGLFTGGWTRQVSVREFGVATTIAGTNMRLNRGGVREMHWHKAAEWAYMLYGNARITAMDAQGRNFVDDVGVGDLWYFPSGIPHSIQGLEPDGAEFLLVFDDGSFDEYNTFNISDWLKHTPNEVLGKNFGVPAALFGHTPDPSERYIFPAPVPGPLGPDKIPGATAVQQTFSYRLMAQEPLRGMGTVSTRLLPASVKPSPSAGIAVGALAALGDLPLGGHRGRTLMSDLNRRPARLRSRSQCDAQAARGDLLDL